MEVGARDVGTATYAGEVLRLLLVLIVLGVAIYAVIRVVQHGGVKGLTMPSRKPRASRPPVRPQGPDDDDDFLRDLDRRRLHPEDPDPRPDN